MQLQSAFPATSKPFPVANPTSSKTSLADRRVLLVEDDVVLVRFLHHIFQHDGCVVSYAHSGLEALASVRADLDFVILDLNLPDMDGLEVLHRIREQFPHLCLLVLTGRTRSESAVQALEAGADDCLHKPFSHNELLARLRALLRRRVAASPMPAIRSSGLTLQKAALRAERDGQPIDLTPREFALLEFLLRDPGIPVPRSVLHQELWGESSLASSNVVDVYMKYLRDKIDLPGKPRLIRTVRGIGYAAYTS